MAKTTGRIDWTGVEPDQTPIAPLDDRTFAVRLRWLSERARELTTLRKAFTEQHPSGEHVSRDSEPASRQSR